MRKCLSVLLVAFVALVHLSVLPAAADPQVYGKTVEIRKVSDVKLGSSAKKDFGDFQGKKHYFGAFYVNVEIDYGHYFRGAASLEAAMQIAEGRCESAKGSGAGKCVLYALAVPKGFPKGAANAFGVPHDGLEFFNEDFLKRAKEGLFSAYALSEIGHAGASWEYESAEEAAEAAVLQCLSGVAEELAKMDKRTREMVRKRGYDGCPVVATRGPG